VHVCVPRALVPRMIYAKAREHAHNGLK
jgi:hypothetical protein